MRRPEAAVIAAACGAELARADVFDEASLRAAIWRTLVALAPAGA